MKKMVLEGAVLLALALASSTVFAQSRPATTAEIAMVRAALQDQLKDADSAKFRNVKIATAGEHKGTICGEVNAKNSYGAYGGYSAFMGMYVGPKDYTDAATVHHKASVIILGVDESDSSVVANVCTNDGF